MPSPISVFIEMPVWMKKYLLSESINNEEPIIFPRKHDYNILLIRLVTNNRNTAEPDYSQSGAKIKLPFSHLKDVYFYNKMSEEARKIFRNQIYRDIYYDFRVFLKDKLLSGEQRKIAVEQFFLLHNITDDDINYSSFYRSFTRYIEKMRVKHSKSTFTDLNRRNVHFGAGRITRKTA